MMTITTPLHGDHQLDQLAGQFAHWRQTRTHPYERIPHEIWEHAVALASALPPSRVAKQVRVRLCGSQKTDGGPSRGDRGGGPWKGNKKVAIKPRLRMRTVPPLA